MPQFLRRLPTVGDDRINAPLRTVVKWQTLPSGGGDGGVSLFRGALPMLLRRQCNANRADQKDDAEINSTAGIVGKLSSECILIPDCARSRNPRGPDTINKVLVSLKPSRREQFTFTHGAAFQERAKTCSWPADPRRKLFARRAGVHIDFHAHRHFNNLSRPLVIAGTKLWRKMPQLGNLQYILTYRKPRFIGRFRTIDRRRNGDGPDTVKMAERVSVNPH